MLVHCCVCHKIKTDDRWRYSVPGELDDELFTSTYCPSCFEEVKRGLDAERIALSAVAIHDGQSGG